MGVSTSPSRPWWLGSVLLIGTGSVLLILEEVIPEIIPSPVPEPPVDFRGITLGLMGLVVATGLLLIVFVDLSASLAAGMAVLGIATGLAAFLSGRDALSASLLMVGAIIAGVLASSALSRKGKVT
jgi:hypothetical protein